MKQTYTVAVLLDFAEVFVEPTKAVSRSEIEKPPIHAIKRVMREAYANAPEHMCREVEDELAEMKRLKEETRQKDRDAKDGETEIERTAEEYAA